MISPGMLRIPGVTHGLAAVIRLVAWLPRGNTMPCETWRRRHAGLRWLLWAHIPALVGLDALVGPRSTTSLLLVPVALLGALSGWGAVQRRLQSTAVALGLLASAALAVSITDGLTEMHFLFFVLVIALSLYEDWLIFGIAIGFVVLHHGLASAVGLGHVYHHAGDSWPWAALHGAFVLAAAAACVVSWRLSEQVRAELMVAERETLESRMREAQKLESLGLLAGGVAHDFNNLLLAVTGNASLALADLSDESSLRTYLEGIERAGSRATDLTKQMLAYAGGGRLMFDEVNISSLVADMTHLLEAGISKNAVLLLELDETVGSVRGDAGQLSQVVMNLITNAAESLDGGTGTICVTTTMASVADLATSGSTHLDPDAAYVLVEVEDTGSGMDEDTVQRMFEPFFTTKFTGRGLGLAAVAGIIRSHDGHIDVTSLPGRGSTFRVFLPATGLAPRQRPTEIVQAPREGRTGTVLVVDDEAIVRDVAATALRNAGFDVIAASGGIDAVDRVRSAATYVGVAVIDMTMPGLNGLETTRALRELQRDLPVILSSGYSAEAAEGASADVSFLQKPYELSQLVELVCQALDEAAPARALAAV
jgi:signal transduction histidine kinase/CheY-like chemotaxis protein